MVANFDRDFSPEKDDGSAGAQAAKAAHENVLSELAGITGKPERGKPVKTLEFARAEFDMSSQIDFSKAYVPDWLVKEKV